MKSISIKAFHVLKAKSRESFNLFVSLDSLDKKSFTTSLSITINKSLFSKVLLSSSSFTVKISFPTANLINHISRTFFLISAKEEAFLSLKIEDFITNFVSSGNSEISAIIEDIESFFTEFQHFTHFLLPT
jgi:hypothetical protein